MEVDEVCFAENGKFRDVLSEASKVNGKETLTGESVANVDFCSFCHKAEAMEQGGRKCLHSGIGSLRSDIATEQRGVHAQTLKTLNQSPGSNGGSAHRSGGVEMKDFHEMIWSVAPELEVM